MDNNKNFEINDDQLENVTGGANLDAWFESGRSGAPICTNRHEVGGILLFGKLTMNSYWKDGDLYVECPFCRVPKKL